MLWNEQRNLEKFEIQNILFISYPLAQQAVSRKDKDIIKKTKLCSLLSQRSLNGLRNALHNIKKNSCFSF